MRTVAVARLMSSSASSLASALGGGRQRVFAAGRRMILALQLLDNSDWMFFCLMIPLRSFVAIVCTATADATCCAAARTFYQFLHDQ